MSEQQTPVLQALPSGALDQLDKLASELSSLLDFTTQAFTARQGFYEKLILLNGATLTLLFTVIGGLSHATLTKATLARVGDQLFIGCWLLILSIMFSLLHNHLNIAYLIHMSGSIRKTSVHQRRILLRLSLQGANDGRKLEELPPDNADAAKDLKKGTRTESLCRWIGVASQALTIFGYVAFVASLHTVVRALAGSQQ